MKTPLIIILVIVACIIGLPFGIIGAAWALGKFSFNVGNGIVGDIGNWIGRETQHWGNGRG